MRQDEIMRILREQGPMTIPDLAMLDTSRKYRTHKLTSINHRLLALERQGMICRMGTVSGDRGHRRTVWGVTP